MLPNTKRNNCLFDPAYTVLVVEDNPELLLRFARAVGSDSRLALIGAVSAGREGIAMLDAHKPNVLMVDLGLPDIDGVEVIAHAARHHPDTEMLVVTMFADDQHVLSSIEAGATGYLLKDSLPARICESIHELLAGGSPITPSIARKVLARFRPVNPSPVADVPARNEALAASQLTTREIDILRLIAKGLSFTELGEALSISPHTVVAHVKKIYRKLAVHSRGEAVFEAGQIGIL